MINTENEVEIIPDSLELEIAYWESFCSEWPMQQYKAGNSLGSIAKGHGRSRESLVAFFERRYGKDWHKTERKPAPPKPKVISVKKAKAKEARIVSPEENAARNRQIVALLCEGWTITAIAKVLGATRQAIASRIHHNNLREVAANDTYKPAYAAA